MMNIKNMEMIAERYGIQVTYADKGKGGFIIDNTGEIYKSMIYDIKETFETQAVNQYQLKMEAFLLAA